jgi:hypothetical protein
VEEVRRNGCEKLYSLIQYYGGRRFLSARLGMTERGADSRRDLVELNWGPFDLDFGVRLLIFVREEQLLKNPPLANPAVAMPSRLRLVSSGDEGLWLAERIPAFGGYENVARRLGLGF